MTITPIRYVEPVFRPPSEADSLILPVTDGCSWNRCTFCETCTAPQKRFRPRSDEVLESIRRCGEKFGENVKRVFLADGDAMTLSIRRLATVLDAIRRNLPGVRGVSSYCLPGNLRKKSAAELRELADLGLSLVYVGAEFGDDEVLARVNKGESFATTREALEKLQEAGVKRSVMILNGLGGQALTRQHALNSASLMNAARPESRHIGPEFPKRRSEAARQLSRLGAAQRGRTGAGDGAVPFRSGSETDRIPQRPRLELACPERNVGSG